MARHVRLRRKPEPVATAQEQADGADNDILVWRPQAGPQEEFLSNDADICIFGGGAGSGKSAALLLEAARHYDITGYSGIIFRRTAPELRGAGSLWVESYRIYPSLGGVSRDHLMEWDFPSGAMLKMSHMQFEHDVHQHQGKAYTFIGFDELSHFTEHQFFYMLSRNRSTCGVRPYVRATTNPDPDSWIREMLAWWIDKDGFAIRERSGIIRWFQRDGDDIIWLDDPQELAEAKQSSNPPISFSFVPALLTDNKILMEKDPGYLHKLMSLPLVERERLLRGNWNIRARAGNVFQASSIAVVDLPPVGNVQRVRAWDLAATDGNKSRNADWSVGVLLSRDQLGTLHIEDVVRVREDPAGVERTIMNTASRDGKQTKVAFWQDPGSAGKMIVNYYQKLLFGYQTIVERASGTKLAYAAPLASQAQAGHLRMVRGPWNQAFLNELENFPDGTHDDQVDALSLAGLVLANSSAYHLRALSRF